MRAGDQHRCGSGDKARINVGRFERHIGAVVAIEQQRKRSTAADTQKDQRSQALRVEPHVADIDPFARQRVEHKAAILFVADSRQHRRMKAEARTTDRGVGRRAAEVAREGRHVFQACADLFAVQIDGSAADADDVERPGCRAVFHCFAPGRFAPAPRGGTR